jgi:hypothetical protein
VRVYLGQTVTVRNSRFYGDGLSITDAVVNLYFGSDLSNGLAVAADALAQAAAPRSPTTLPPSAGIGREQNSAHSSINRRRFWNRSPRA